MQKKLIFNALTLINEPLNILIAIKAIKGKKNIAKGAEHRNIITKVLVSFKVLNSISI
jgi:hypothetical protein